ncbi:hypothetical protein CVT25_011696 [Psilocybe cyanescens]|uniref:Uncharacterized protein n=1 Tax=Psilocybe cyanescens TaxID=93625 RepID=A0A409WIK7_PSICY|nr:hypothetical protein CVT25_011696 [Psilocybe cyanescens]
MDASDSVYYPFPDNGHTPGNDPRHCSVRGCTQLVTNGSQNKMCDACRGRHRIYASTKRARRKLEKAAVAARNGQEPLDPVQNGISSPIVTASSWMSGNADTFHEVRASSPNPHSSVSGPSSSISPFLSASWNQAIDPRLFAQDTLTSPSLRLHLHRTSSSSELANALTLPPPRPRIQAESVSDENRDPEEHIEEDKECKSTQASGDAAAKDLGEGPTRLCSVKGCKSVLPPSYEFKMCSPCRDRYRTYGTTKRAKWKTEREAFDREMAGLRALEDKKRELEGLSVDLVFNMRPCKPLNPISLWPITQTSFALGNSQ